MFLHLWLLWTTGIEFIDLLYKQLQPNFFMLCLLLQKNASYKNLNTPITSKFYLQKKGRNGLLPIHFVFILPSALLLNFTWLFFPLYFCQWWEISNPTYRIRPYLKMKRKHICTEIHWGTFVKAKAEWQSSSPSSKTCGKRQLHLSLFSQWLITTEQVRPVKHCHIRWCKGGKKKKEERKNTLYLGAGAVHPLCFVWLSQKHRHCETGSGR